MEGGRNIRALFVVFLVMFVVAQHTSARSIVECAKCAECYVEHHSISQCAAECLGCVAGGSNPPPLSSQRHISSVDPNFICFLDCAESSCSAHVNDKVELNECITSCSKSCSNKKTIH